MKTNILPILIILFIGVFAGNSIITPESIKSPPSEQIKLNPSLTNNQLIIDLNSKEVKVNSTAVDQPSIKVNIEQPIKTEIVRVPYIVRDTIETIVFREKMYPLNPPKWKPIKPVFPSSVKRIS